MFSWKCAWNYSEVPGKDKMAPAGTALGIPGVGV